MVRKMIVNVLAQTYVFFFVYINGKLTTIACLIILSYLEMRGVMIVLRICTCSSYKESHHIHHAPYSQQY